MKKCVLFLIAIAFIFGASYAAPLKNGTYISKNSLFDVHIDIKNGKIVNIEIIEHGMEQAEYLKKIEPLIDKIITQQSADVDTVTGATLSSETSKKAVDDVLKRAGR